MAMFRGIDLGDEAESVSDPALVERVMRAAGLALDATYEGEGVAPAQSKEDKPWPHFRWRLAVQDAARPERPLLVVPDWKSGTGHVREGRWARPKPPTWYDLWTALTKEAPGSFAEFCGEYGYDEDSRRAYATWEGRWQEWERVEACFRRLVALLPVGEGAVLVDFLRRVA
jgi:hypothetical protein